MLKLSNENISRLYLGNTEIVKAYMGSDLVFSKTKTYTVTASIDPAGSGTVTGAGQYQEGAEVTITATPAEGYNFSGWQESRPLTLPTGYTVLEYIESSGTQYINMGINPKANTKIDADIYMAEVPSSTVMIFGVYDASGSSYSQFKAFVYNPQIMRFIFGTKQSDAQNAFSAGRHSISIDASKKQAHYDSEIISLSDASSLPKYNIFLFANNNNGAVNNFASMRLYSCKIYEGDTCVRNFVPCISPSGAVGLYDSAHSVFYGNSGTGTFAAGPETEGTITETVSESATYTFTVTGNRALTAVFAEIPQSRLPAGYTELQYIQSSGTQHVDTGIVPDTTTKVVMDAQALSANTTSYGRYFFGSYYKNINNQWAFGIYFWKPGTLATMGRAAASGAIPEKVLSSSTSPSRVLLELDADNKTASFNGAVSSMSSNVLSTSMPALKLLSGGSFTTNVNHLPARLYSCQIYKNNALKRDFVPCTNPSGQVGLYDLATDSFYANSGTGTFTAGPAV